MARKSTEKRIHTHTHAYNMFRNNENVVKHKAQRSSLIAKEIKT